MSLNETGIFPEVHSVPCILGSMEVYVINMAQSTQRWAYMQGYLRDKGLDPTRIDAVDGRQLAKKELFLHYDENANERDYFLPLKPAEIGCFLSHKKAMKTFISESDKPYLLLLEDDIEFCVDIALAAPSWLEVLERPSPTMLKLYTKRNVSGSRIMEDCLGQIIRPYMVPLGTPAQVLNRAAAIRLLLLCERFSMPVDVAYQYWWNHGVTVLANNPSQVKEVSHHLDGTSIGGSYGLTPRQKLKRELGRSWFRLKLNICSYWHYFNTKGI